MSQNEPNGNSSARRQGRYWLCTLPAQDEDRETLVFPHSLPDSCAYICGQLEEGLESGYLHWQFLVCFKRKVSLRSLQESFPGGHYELSRSRAAEDYVGKEATRVGDSYFLLGDRPIRRNSGEDWERVWELAVSGKFLEIPANIRVINLIYLRFVIILLCEESALTLLDRIQSSVLLPSTGGQQERVKLESLGNLQGWMLTLKFPTRNSGMVIKVNLINIGQRVVVIDEFRGDISISNLLRWFDRYPVLVEIKGSSTVLMAETIYVTSNLDPREWYRDVDSMTVDALMRRLNIVHVPFPLYNDIQ